MIYHGEVAAETRQLGADDEVTLLDALEQLAQLPFVVRLRAADGLLNPSVDAQMFTLAELVDFKSLVLHCLLVAAHSDVSVNHVQIFYLH